MTARRWTSEKEGRRHEVSMGAASLSITSTAKDTDRNDYTGCALDEFLDGSCQHVVREALGPEGLAEVVSAATRAMESLACHCELFASGTDRRDPEREENLRHIRSDAERTPGDDQYTWRCTCCYCGSRWRVSVDTSYHRLLFTWERLH
jgi:hypothetical protein